MSRFLRPGRRCGWPAYGRDSSASLAGGVSAITRRLDSDASVTDGPVPSRREAPPQRQSHDLERVSGGAKQRRLNPRLEHEIPATNPAERTLNPRWYSLRVPAKTGVAAADGHA